MELSSSLMLAPSLRPPSNLLLRILLFLLLLLWPNAGLCRCTGALARLKHQLKRTHVETNVPRKLTVLATARTIFSPPHKAQMVSEGEPHAGKSKAPRQRGWVYSQTRSTAPNGQLPLHLGPTKTSAKDLARSRSVRIGVVRFEKSLVANLSAKRQLSVAKLSAKRIFSLAKWDFLVANGRMAADFSSPVTWKCFPTLQV